VTARFARVYLDEDYLREAEAMLTAAIQYETVVQGPSWPRDRRSLLLLKSLGLTLWRQGKLEGAAEALEALYQTSKDVVGEMDDLNVWAAGRLRDVRERINCYAHSKRHAVAASTLPKPSPAAQASGDEDTNLTPESFTIGVSDEEWSLLQVVEGSEAEFGPSDRDTLQAKFKLALFYERSEMFGKAGMWYEQVYQIKRLSSTVNLLLEKVIRCLQTCNELAELVRGDSHADFMVSAARMNRTDLVDMLLAAGAMANARDDTGFAPLHHAAFHINELMTRHLLEAGADVNAFSGSETTPLHHAVMSNWQQNQGRLRFLRLLISGGADVNAKGPNQWSVLCTAVIYRSKECVELLLEKGAHVNADCGKEYGNALQQAIIRGNFKIIQLLLQHGADVHAQGGKYGNALQAASYSCSQIKVPKLLLENGADVNAPGGKYPNALGAASSAGHDIVARFLLANGANPDAR
jgi:ankyrin repeat protein